MQTIQITNLPNEMLVEMVKYLTIKERHNVLGKVNKLFHSVVQQFVIEDKKKLTRTYSNFFNSDLFNSLHLKNKGGHY